MICYLFSVYRGMQHDCNEDERYRPHQVNMFMRQNESKHPDIQSTFIKSPKHIHRCRHHEYQWLFYNLSPHDCKFRIVCDTFVGGDCENPYYVLQLFSIEQWNPESGVFHSEKEEKDIEKICKKNEVHQKEVKNNQALVVDMFLQVDALDLPDDASFSCKVTYDCKDVRSLEQGTKNYSTLSSVTKLHKTTQSYQETTEKSDTSIYQGTSINVS